MTPVKQVVDGFDSGISIRFELLKTQVESSLLRERLMAALCGFFGILALILSVIGLYGVVSYITTQRQNEIGLRLALGAQRSDISRLILADVGVLLATGIGLGLVCSVPAARAARSLLFGLEAYDPATLAAAVVTLTLTALIATLLPTWRATQIDPMTALRRD